MTFASIVTSRGAFAVARVRKRVVGVAVRGTPNIATSSTPRRPGLPLTSCRAVPPARVVAGAAAAGA